MIKAARSGVSALCAFLCLVLLWPAIFAHAVSAEWRILAGRNARERVVISYAGPDGKPGTPARNGLTSIAIPWPGSPLLSVSPSAPAGSLFSALRASSAGLILNVSDSAFGFIASTPQAGVLQIDIFKNAMGARWKPPPGQSSSRTSGQSSSQKSGSASETGESRAAVSSEAAKAAEAVGERTVSGAAGSPSASSHSARLPIRREDWNGAASSPVKSGEDSALAQPASDAASAADQPPVPVSEPASRFPAGEPRAALEPDAGRAGSITARGSALGIAPDDAAVPPVAPDAVAPDDAAVPPVAPDAVAPDDREPENGELPNFPDILSGERPDGAGPVTSIRSVNERNGQEFQESPGPTLGVFPDNAGEPESPRSFGAPSDAVRPGVAEPQRPAVSPQSSLPPLQADRGTSFLPPDAPTAPDSGVPAPFFEMPAQPLVPGAALPPVDFGDQEIELPDWPPLRMPNSLPNLPPPAQPQPQSAAPFTGGAGGALSGDYAFSRALSLGRAEVYFTRPDVSLPRPSRTVFFDLFRAGEAVAAQADGQAYDVIDAPFIYRSKLSREADAQPERIPVLVRVPVGTAGADAPGAGAGQTAAVPAPDGQARTAAGQSGQSGQEALVPEPNGRAEQPAAVPAPDGPSQPASAVVGVAPSSGSKSAGAAAGQTPAGAESAQAKYPELLQKTQGSEQGGSWTQPNPKDDSGKTLVYVDEEGNPLPPPLDPASASMTLEQSMSYGEYQDAFDLATQILRQDDLSAEQREYFLHRRADAMFSLHRDNPGEAFADIVETTTQAINFNSKSPRNAGPYLRLGYVNLKAGNAYEAEGYFSLLRTQYPRDESIPLSYYYMGDYQYEQGNLNDAALQFLHVVQQYPDSRYSRDAAIGLTRTMYRQGYYDKAYEVIDYVEKRWPRYYLDYPPTLNMMGDTAYRSRHLDRARQSYWLYYNLVPDAPDADIVLARLGDIYFAQKNRNAAVHVYEEAARSFPGKDGGIIAMMRLAENSINDEPTLARMYRVFQQPYNLRQAETYRKIIKEWPDSPLAPLAKLKLAMWSLWQKDFENCFSLCNEIVMADSASPLAARALEVSRNAFALLAADSVNSRRYDRVRDAWDRYPVLHAQEEFLDPESRLALAVSQWESLNPDGALHTIEPFFLGAKIPEYSEMALLLALNIFVQNDRWEDVRELAQRVELWELTPETQRQLDYAMGLTHESQGRPEEAMPIWKSLYEQDALPPAQQAYAEYFLARSAQKEDDLETAYRIGQDALERMKELAAQDPGQADSEKIKNLLVSLMDISQSAGMLQESLDYAQDYLKHAEPGTDDYLSVMYSMANMYRSRGSMGEWEKTLKDLSEKYPQSYHGRAAASQLNMYRMNRSAAQFAPGG